MNAVGLAVFHPLETIPVEELIDRFASLVDHSRVSHGRGLHVRVFLLVAVLLEGLPQDGRSFYWVLLENVLKV